MRPVRLEVEGFTCYRDRQPVLEFSDLTLFAIAGPTGAGKSSILDAMLYALFGEVPRIGKQGVAEFISQGRDRMSVTLDFRVRNRDYRVTRASRQLKSSVKTDATLAELTAAGERSIAGQVKPVNDAIVELLGLGYDEFIQTVVLPQGEFAKFLKAKPTDQRSILQHLLRHHVFTRMRDLAEGNRRKLDVELSGLDGKLSGLGDATDEALAVSEGALSDARTRQADAAQASNAADLLAQDARVRRKHTEEYERLCTQRGALGRDAAKIDRLREELEQARRASPIMPRLDAFKSAASRVGIATDAHTKARSAAERSSVAKAEAAKRATLASEAAKECEALSARLRALDEISSDVARQVQLAGDLKAVGRQLSASEASLKAARDADAAAQKTVRDGETRLRELQNELAGAGVDDALLEAIEGAFASVGAAKAVQQEIASLESELARSETERSEANRKADAARVAYAKAQQESEVANEAVESSRAALDAGRNRDRAAALRAHLHAGDACPVCQQVVTDVPPAAAGPELSSLEKAVTESEGRAARADMARRKADKASADATAALNQAAKAVDTVITKLAERRAQLIGVLSTLEKIVPAGEAVSGPAVVSWMEARRDSLRAARNERARRERALHEAETTLHSARLSAAKAEDAAKRASDSHQRLHDEQAKLTSELAAVTSKIQAVSTSPDPLSERTGLAKRIEALQAASRQAVDDLTKAANEVIRTEAEVKAAQDALSAATAHLAETEDALAGALAEAGFPTGDAAVACVRSDAQQKTIQSQVSAFDGKRAGVLQRLAELEPQVRGKEMSADNLAEIERQARAAVEASRLADQAAARLESEVTRLRTAVKERAAVVAQKDALGKTFAITAELAADLKGDRFQEYVLEEAFKTLVTGASVRLKAISNRYTLQWESGDFYVVDHDNAGERRRAETLSGGETFMASLCLALQLSEEVLRTSGALQMDSLFIDEGFGTLDSDSLSEVTDAMETLRQDGDRMIGVISHRPELTDRLPGCIRVNKGTGESNWILERVG
jgi:exonuclease SbcC